MSVTPKVSTALCDAFRVVQPAEIRETETGAARNLRGLCEVPRIPSDEATSSPKVWKYGVAMAVFRLKLIVIDSKLRTASLCLHVRLLLNPLPLVSSQHPKY